MDASIELVVTDLDGTLWERPTSVPEETKRALLDVVAGDVPLLVATGRRIVSTREPLAALGVVPPAVVLNGSLGLDLQSSERFHRGGFSVADAVAVLEVFESAGVSPCVYVDHDTPSVWLSEAPSTHPDHVRSFGVDVGVDVLADVVANHLILGFSVLGVDVAIVERIEASLAGLATPHAAPDRQYPGHTLTVAPKAGSKWDGIAAFCAAQGLDASRVLVMGDGPNDVEMLEKAAVALVPEDGHDEALALADHVISRAEEGGWTAVLDFL